jgi:hypothetical protein
VGNTIHIDQYITVVPPGAGQLLLTKEYSSAIKKNEIMSWN